MLGPTFMGSTPDSRTRSRSPHKTRIRCHFSPSWVHQIFRVMGPGEHAKRPVERVARMGVGVERIFDRRLGVGAFGRDP